MAFIQNNNLSPMTTFFPNEDCERVLCAYSQHDFVILRSINVTAAILPFEAMSSGITEIVTEQNDTNYIIDEGECCCIFNPKNTKEARESETLFG